MKPRFFFLVTLSLVSAFSANAEDKQVDKARSALQEWVETRQIISKEKADWAILKETLVDTQALLETQKKQLDEKITELNEAKTGADDEREELMAENAELKEATKALEEQVAKVESQVLAVAKRFPQNLQDTIDPLIRRIPEPGTKSKAALGERVQNIVGILLQTDKFNNQITVVDRTQVLPDGREVQVSTMFFGLGQAYFVDTTGSYAGVGVPTADGWVYEQDNSIAPMVQNLIDIHSGEATEVTFIPVPAKIQ
ncbi:DUF3450 family protein [Rubellicoccus peritrichatus]|uniref:DUF3450 family protein n=1 Tax=Rubellicoccus peritrichatus TaxID=3080537 RepID=A0AAQ3QXC6_9BACT|nr:DUF3450 family protein [Puniceicoccus sp. CR14]WOO42735.1 DUF3450 family protein [Puniceicoccus sp. CR14]